MVAFLLDTCLRDSEEEVQYHFAFQRAANGRERPVGRTAAIRVSSCKVISFEETLLNSSTIIHRHIVRSIFAAGKLLRAKRRINGRAIRTRRIDTKD